MHRHRRKRPAWLMGLTFAVVVSLVVILLFMAFGYGDDPVLGSLGAGLR